MAISLTGAVLPIIFYFILRCHRYFTDGLTYALEIETVDTWLVHPNHPLFPLLPQILHRLGKAVSEYPGLELLSNWAILAGILAAWGMLYLFQMVKIKPATAIVSFSLFTFSAGVWYFGSTANQYSTALALHVFTLIALARIMMKSGEPSTLEIVLTGALCSLAILAHQVNLLLLIPMCFIFFSGKLPTGRKLSATLTAAGTALSIAVIVTLLLGVTLIGLRTPSDFIAWQQSYVTEPWYWANSVTDSLSRTAKGAVELHLAHAFHPEGIFGNWRMPLGTSYGITVLVFRLAQAFILSFIVFESIRAILEWFRAERKPRLQTLGLAAWLPFAIFCFFFTPETYNYRVFYMPGFIIFIAPAIGKHFSLDSWKIKRAWPVLLMIVCLFATNFTVKFLPEHSRSNNPMLAEAIRLSGVFGPGDLMIYSGADVDYLRADYTRYFAGCDTMILPELIEKFRESPDDVVADFETRTLSGGNVAVHEDALYSDEDREWVNRFYGMDIRELELAEFLDLYAAPADIFILNEKKFFMLETGADEKGSEIQDGNEDSVGD